MDHLSLAKNILRLARANSIKIVTAESCTGGLLAGAITEAPGSSDIFDCGYITYSNAAKTDMLGVNISTLNQSGAVSEQVAQEMAVGALRRARADLAVSVTGIAGPGGSDHKPEGRVCFALVQTDRSPISETIEFSAIGRDAVRAAAVKHALQMIVTALS